MTEKVYIKKRMFEAGIHIINDLISTDGKFLSFNQYKISYDSNVNFIEYNGLIRAIRVFRQSKYSNIAAFPKFQIKCFLL